VMDLLRVYRQITDHVRQIASTARKGLRSLEVPRAATTYCDFRPLSLAWAQPSGQHARPGPTQSRLRNVRRRGPRLGFSQTMAHPATLPRGHAAFSWPSARRTRSMRRPTEPNPVGRPPRQDAGCCRGDVLLRPGSSQLPEHRSTLGPIRILRYWSLRAERSGEVCRV